MRISILGFLSLPLYLAACGQASGPSQAPADYVFTNGQVYTVNSAQEWAEAVAVSDNKIVFVGSAADAGAYVGDGTEVIDASGKMILPGFVSGHDHLTASNWTKAGVNLFPGRSKEDYLQLIKEYADANPDEEFVYGYGYNYQFLGNGRRTNGIYHNFPVSIYSAQIQNTQCPPRVSSAYPSTTGISAPPRLEPVDAKPITLPIEPGGVTERSRISREGMSRPIR